MNKDEAKTTDYSDEVKIFNIRLTRGELARFERIRNQRQRQREERGDHTKLTQRETILEALDQLEKYANKLEAAKRKRKEQGKGPTATT